MNSWKEAKLEGSKRIGLTPASGLTANNLSPWEEDHYEADITIALGEVSMNKGLLL